MQDKSPSVDGVPLRVAASFNSGLDLAPFGRWTQREKPRSAGDLHVSFTSEAAHTEGRNAQC